MHRKGSMFKGSALVRTDTSIKGGARGRGHALAGLTQKAGKWRKIEDYSRHMWTAREIILEAVKCTGVVLLFSWFFYRSIWAVLPMSIVGVMLWKKDSRKKRIEDQRRLEMQFCDCIRNADTSMRAGYSVENAFLASLPDMRLMHGEDSFICLELERMKRGIVINIAIEELFLDWGNRSGSASIREFAEVLSIAKRSGGSIPDIIRASAGIILKRMEAEEEIYTQTTARRLEQRIMNLMPFGIAIYLESGNPGYFDVLFYNFQGVCIMTGCLIVYLTAYYMSEKIIGQTMKSWG